MALFESSIKSLPRLGKGKVRDIYAVGADKMLIVASDRLSAFDVVLPDPIPDKGRVLNEMANFWFERLGHVVPNQLTGIDPESVVAEDEKAQVRGPLGGGEEAEAAADRGGGARLHHRLGLEGLPEERQDLRHRAAEGPAAGAEAARADLHAGDQGRDRATTRTSRSTQAEKLIGKPTRGEGARHQHPPLQGSGRLRGDAGASSSPTRSSSSAWMHKSNLVLIDEVLTADSSRFWPADSYRVGISPPSFDKQYVRDYLESLDWDKTPPAPKLPEDVIARTSEKYREALERLTGRKACVIGIVMGSTSDWETMKAAAKVLEEFGVPYEAKAMSAHRTPHAVAEWASNAPEERHEGDHRRGRRRGAPRGRGRRAHHAAGARRADALQAPAGARLAALHGADAEGHPGGDLRDRRGRRRERGAVRGGAAGAFGHGARRRSWPTSARKQTEAVLKAAPLKL